MKENPRLWIGRAQLIGDQIAALPTARYFKKLYPNSHLIWPIAGKISQVAPLYINCPWIDEIYVTDGLEGPESERDIAKMKTCDYCMEVNPCHPDNRYPLEFNIYSESWRMAGLNIDVWNLLTEEERRPKLEKWFKPESRPFNLSKDDKIVALWGFASYGNREPKRNPNKEWYYKLALKLIENNISIVQFGHPNDPVLFGDLEQESYFRLNHLDIFTQIKITLSTDCMLGTDSGSSLVMAAYGFRQVTLLTDHWGNINNPYALAPDNPNNVNFFAPNGCNNISIDSVVAKVLELVK